MFIEAPPTEDAQPENVLKYLAHYMTGGPISDQRLISHDGKAVRFWARSQDKPSGSALQPPVSSLQPPLIPEQLPAVEFTRRWALHIPPKGFMKVRRYGGFSNTKRKAYLGRCRQTLGLVGSEELGPTEQQLPTDSTDSGSDTQEYSLACPRCRQPLTCIASSHRPSWRDTFSSSYRPPWYHDA